jgi:hypothetical protein
MSTGPSTGAAVGPEGIRNRTQRLQARIDPVRLAWPALLFGLLAGGVALLYLMRGTTFWFDEWVWITGRRGTSAGTFLDSHNGHLSLVPVAIYKLLFVTAGLRHYAAYRVAVTLAHLACVALVYVYSKRRVGELPALLAAVLILLFGPGWQDILWPFQIAWIIAVCTGIGALLMLDRGDRRGDVVACLLVAVSIASTSVGLAVAAGIVVEIAWVRRRWQDGWIVGIPLLLYLVWSLAYGGGKMAGSLSSTVEFIAQSASVSLAALSGLSGVTAVDTTGTVYTFGAPLAVAAVAVLVWLTRRANPWRGRATTLATMLLAFWVLTALGRSDFSDPEASRYLYIDGVLVMLLTVELARGVALRGPALALLTILTAAALISNVGGLRTSASFFRGQASLIKADLAALNLSRPFVRPTYVVTSFPGYPLITLSAANLFAAQRDLGSDAYTPAQLHAAPADARHVADAEMVTARRLAIQPAQVHAANTVGPAPRSDLVSAGTVASSQSCASYTASVTALGRVNQVQFAVPRQRLELVASRSPATIGVRRYGNSFLTLGTIPAGVAAKLEIPTDSDSQRWHLQVLTTGGIQVCGLSG